jgi:hypothetical protein
MRTAAICPTCATYTNAVCVLYDGPYLSNLDIAPLTDLEEIIGIINSKVQLKLGYTPENVANKSTNVLLGTSNTLYPTQNAVKTYVDSSISAIPVPTLQQVTASGNSTDIGILVADSGNVDTVEITPGNVKIYYDPSGEFVQIDKNTVTFNNGNFDLDIVNPTLTAARTINIPDASGIFALSVNGVGADANGNVTLPITALYKVYTASLTFNGTSNPIVTVYQNTIGNGSGDGVNDIAITIQNFGLWFEANMTGSTAFPAGKTWMQPSSYFGNNNSYNVYFYRMSNTQIRFQSIDTTDASVSFANGFSVNFEIRVYP